MGLSRSLITKEVEETECKHRTFGIIITMHCVAQNDGCKIEGVCSLIELSVVHFIP